MGANTSFEEKVVNDVDVYDGLFLLLSGKQKTQCPDRLVHKQCSPLLTMGKGKEGKKGIRYMD